MPIRVIVTSFLLVLASWASAATAKPNIIVILSDDQGYHDLGVQGCRDIPTPHIDSLAQTGVRFTSGYVSGPYCSPTRVGLMTGRYQQRTGNEYLTGWNGNQGMALKATTVAQRLRQAGYMTGIVGKWHLGEGPGYHPLDRGFAEFYGFLGGGHHYFPEARTGKPDHYDTPIWRKRKPVKEGIGYLTTAFGREASSFVQRHREQPFFLYLAFNAVHAPLEAPPEYLAKFPNLTGNRRAYAAMLSAMDDAVGDVLASVKEAGMEDRTLIFFLSDNGGPITHNAPNGSSNAPLRGGKGETWEGGVRVPFIAKWKGVLPAGQTYAPAVIQLDITATALSAAGLTLQPEWQLDGVDLLPYLLGKKSGAPHDALYWRLGQQMAVVSGDWKLVTPYRNEKSMGPPPPQYDWPAHARLFHLGEDVAEQTDLTEQHPEKTKEMGALWSTWNATLPPNRPRPSSSQ